jgi:isochorismate synthase EntC
VRRRGEIGEWAVALRPGLVVDGNFATNLHVGTYGIVGESKEKRREDPFCM